MVTANRVKVKSTPFSEFVRHASTDEKKIFFGKVVKATIKEQQAMITKAKEMNSSINV